MKLIPKFWQLSCQHEEKGPYFKNGRAEIEGPGSLITLWNHYSPRLLIR